MTFLNTQDGAGSNDQIRFCPDEKRKSNHYDAYYIVVVGLPCYHRTVL